MGLFTPIWMTEDYNKRDKAVRAVGRITDPDKLVRIATTAPKNEVRVAAVRQLRDEKRLAEVAMTALPKETFYEYSGKDGAPAVAARSIRDEALLGRIALTSPVERAQRAAVENIESQPLLVKIALESGNMFTSEDAAKKVRDPELSLKLAMSDRECGVYCAYVVSDPEAIRKIAFEAPMAKARRAATSHLKDADALIGILEREREKGVLQEARWQLDKCKKEAPLTPAQRERLVELLLRQPDDGRESVLSVALLDDPEDLRRVLLKSARADFQAVAFARLADSASVEELPEPYKEAVAFTRLADSAGVEELPGLYKEAVRQAGKPRLNSLLQKAWSDTKKRVVRRVVQEERGNPDLLMAFVRDAEVGPSMASQCISLLFFGNLNGHDGIDAMRDEAVKTYVDHIPEYEKLNSEHDEKYCVMALAHLMRAFAGAMEKYGFHIWEDQYEDEDQFGRNTVTVTHVEWQGKSYS